jgi:phage terminase large subunit
VTAVVERKTIVELPKKLRFLRDAHRYKVVHGGRGSAKSWTFARQLLVLGTEKPLRILCAREVQESIKESVHKLLSDQIKDLDLSDFYAVYNHAILGKNGTEFAFTGLLEHTVTSIKSYEGVDICWIEEAQTVSGESWNILVPTIRKEHSEIWISFNPELDTDEVYLRFVVKPPPDAVVVEMNWRDNPWFNAVLEGERVHAKATLDEDEYNNIWEGQTRSAVAGAIYAQQILALSQRGRITQVPYEPRLQVHAVFDLGWNMVCGLWQRGPGGALRGIGYIEERDKTIDWFAATLKDMRLNWGAVWLPADGFVQNYQHPTGKSAEEIFRAAGFTVQAIPKLPTVEAGIKAAKMMFGQTYLDADAMAAFIEHVKRYRRHVSKAGVIGDPLHDEHSHAADMFRYTAQAAESMTNEIDPRPVHVPAYEPFDSATGVLG